MNLEKIRVAKFLNVFAIGGTERQFVNIVKRLDASRFDLHVICFRKWGAFLPEVEASGWPVRAFKVQGMFNHRTLRSQLEFARYLRQHRIQVLHTYGWYANVFGIPAAKFAGVPVTIASIRDTGAHLTPRQLQVQRAVCRLATSVLANSDAVRSWLIKSGFRRHNIEVIRNGIVQPEGTSLLKSSNIRREFGIPADAPLVGMVCRLNAVKAVDQFLDAAALVSRDHPSARFLIVGDGELRQQLEGHAARLGIADRVVFTGFRMDTAQILPQLTISVLSSLTEGLSNTLLESMAAGVPAIATRVGGNAEIVADGETGIMVPPHNPPALKEAICRLLSNPALARQMGESGRERIRKHFSVESAVRSTELLYTQLLGARAAA